MLLTWPCSESSLGAGAGVKVMRGRCSGAVFPEARAAVLSPAMDFRLVLSPGGRRVTIAWWGDKPVITRPTYHFNSRVNLNT